MRLILCLSFASALWAAAPTATLTLTEKDSATQTGRPFFISYVFREGEIPNYSQPVVDGTPKTTWQCTDKTRWRDGSATRTVTDASNTEPIYVSTGSTAHGFRTGESITIADVAGNTAANGRWKIIAVSRTTFALLGSSGNGSYSSGGTATGPGPGSLKHALIAFTEDFTSGQEKALTFRNSVNPCSSGDQSACDAAGLDATEMLAFNSSNWNGKIETTASSITHNFADARQMLTDGNFTYWVRGPVATVVIARDLTDPTTYGEGYNCLTNCTGDHSTATWENDATYDPLNPAYELWFFTGWSGVRIDYILENTWITHSKPQRYSWAAKSDTSFSTTEASGSDLTHYQGARWRATSWDGDEPGTVEIDRNRKYLQWTGVIPNYPLNKTATSTDETNLYNRLSGATYTVGSGTGLWNTYFPATGGREDLGMLPSWYVTFLMAGFPVESEPYILKLGDMSGHVDEGRNYDKVRVHLRESVTSDYYFDSDNDGTAASDADDNITDNSAFGRPISIHTRPTSSGNGSIGWTWAVDPTSSVWTADLAHQYGMVHFPYLISGDPYYLEEMQFWASFDVWAPASGVTASDSRHGSWGVLVPQGWETRSMGWVIRNMASAAYWSPDGTMEKEYFTRLLDNQLAEREGFAGVRGSGFLKVTNAPDSDPCPASGGTNGGKSYNAWDKTSYDPAYSTPWCWGLKIPSSGLASIANPLGFPASYGMSPEAGMLGTRVNSPWMLGFVWQGLGWAKDLGYPADDLLQGSSRIALWMTTHPDWNEKYTAAYRMPMYDDGTPWASGTSLAQSLDQFYYLWGTYAMESWGTQTGWPDGYTFTWSGALSYMTRFAHGAATGWDAWDWYSNESNVTNIASWAMDYPGSSNFQYEYKHAMQPRIDPVEPTVQAGDTFAIFRYTAPADDSSCTVAGASDGLTGRDREFVKTGLTAATAYEHAVSCGDDPWGSTTLSYTTLGTLSGTADLTIRLGDGADVVLSHGTTPSLGTDEDSVSCSSGCTVTAAGLSKGLHYFQITRASGQESPVNPVIVR